MFTAKRLFIMPICAILLACLAVNTAAARIPQTGNSTSITYTLSSDGSWLRTQDAYLPGEILFQDDPLWQPEDVYVYGNCLYIAAAGNGYVVAYDLDTRKTRIYGEGTLNTPTGIYVTGRQELYVADSGFSKVFVFDAEGKLLSEYDRPDEMTFGAQAQFKPKKLVVDESGVMSIVSEGSYDGVIQLGAEGEFLGYFGYNSVPMTLLELLQDRFFTEEQKKQLFNRIPLTFYNLASDPDGIIYTITQSAVGNAIKKHNISGVNIIKHQMIDEKNFTDIAVGPTGQIYAVTQTGLIFEYDNDGNLLFSFGGQAISSERSGLLTIASGIAVDDEYNLYVLDKERGLVHTYVPTAFANLAHEAINEYRQGSYTSSRDKLNMLLMLAGNARFIYYYLGKNELQLRNHQAAAVFFRQAGDRSGYSEAFWEIRNDVINAVLPWMFAVFLATVLFNLVRRLWKGKQAAHQGTRFLVKSRILSDLMFGFNVLRHPIDSFYEVKTGARGSIWSAVILYLLAFGAFAFDYLGRGFAYSLRTTENTSPLYVILLFFLPVALFIICSYMVSELHDGKGWFMTVFIGMSYALVPWICFLPAVTVMTHVLALNESFLITFSSLLVYAWTTVLVILAIREIHEYELHQVLGNIMLTFFMMVVVIFAFSIIGMFWDKAIEIASSITREVKYRVGH